MNDVTITYLQEERRGLHNEHAKLVRRMVSGENLPPNHLRMEAALRLKIQQLDSLIESAPKKSWIRKIWERLFN